MWIAAMNMLSDSLHEEQLYTLAVKAVVVTLHVREESLSCHTITYTCAFEKSWLGVMYLCIQLHNLCIQLHSMYLMQ